VLVEAAARDPGIGMAMGRTIEAVARDGDGVMVTTDGSAGRSVERGAALVGSDGLWSATRGLIGDAAPPAYRGRTAWRAMLP
uniref:hypothetical protein n=1 Tax=Streptococcus pneumoniae TaxID=1313 RepID=UPI0019540491